MMPMADRPEFRGPVPEIVSGALCQTDPGPPRVTLDGMRSRCRLE